MESEHKNYNLMLVPGLKGWERLVSKHRQGGRRKDFYTAPCGRRIRSLEEVHGHYYYGGRCGHYYGGGHCYYYYRGHYYYNGGRCGDYYYYGGRCGHYYYGGRCGHYYYCGGRYLRLTKRGGGRGEQRDVTGEKM